MVRKGSMPPDVVELVKKRGQDGMTVPTSFSMTAKDKEMIGWLADYFGTNKSEAVRSAVRHMAAHVGYLERSQ